MKVRALRASPTHDRDQARRDFALLASPDDREGSLRLHQGDGAALSEEGRIELTGQGKASEAEVLLFDLA